MSKPFFERILTQLQDHNNYFVLKYSEIRAIKSSKTDGIVEDACYEIQADRVDEYVKIGKSTTIESLKMFCRGVANIFK